MFIRALDMLSPSINFTVGGEYGVKTSFGMVMTLSYLLGISIFSGVILKTFFSTLDPDITHEESTGNTFSRVDFAHEKYVPVLYLFTGPSPMSNENYQKYITPVLLKSRFKLVADSNGKVSSESFMKIMPVVPCENLNATSRSYYKKYENTKYFKTFANTTGLCVELDEEEAYIEGGGADTSIDLISLTIYPCSLQVGCATAQEMRAFSIIVGLPSFSSNYSNYQEPVSSSLEADGKYFVNDRTSQIFAYHFKLNQIYDDPGLMFKKVLKTTYNSIDKVSTSNNFREEGNVYCPIYNISSCQSYFQFTFTSGNKKVMIMRSYRSLTHTISEIGGMNTVIYVVFLSINSLYLFFKKRSILAERVFSFSKISDLVSKNIPYFGGSHRDDQTHEKGVEKNKKSSPDESLRLMKDKSLGLVEDGMDFITLMKEINTIKVMSHLFLKSYHMKLVPLVAMTLRKSQKSADPHTQSKRKDKEDSKALIESKSLEEAIDQLKLSHAKATSVPPERNTLEEKIDIVYWDILNGKYDDSNQLNPEQIHNEEPREMPDPSSSDHDQRHKVNISGTGKPFRLFSSTSKKK